jgi:hypothetical protein
MYRYRRTHLIILAAIISLLPVYTHSRPRQLWINQEASQTSTSVSIRLGQHRLQDTNKIYSSIFKMKVVVRVMPSPSQNIQPCHLTLLTDVYIFIKFTTVRCIEC